MLDLQLSLLLPHSEQFIEWCECVVVVVCFRVVLHWSVLTGAMTPVPSLRELILSPMSTLRFVVITFHFLLCLLFSHWSYD